MLNLERIKHMTKLASYEAGEGGQNLSISKYYRSDYLGLALIKNFFLITIAYVVIVAIILGYQAEYLMDNVQNMELVPTVVKLVLGYIVMLVGYSIITYVYHSVKYRRAKKSVSEYYNQLTKLSKMYEREEKESGKKPAGGRNRA